MAAVISYPCERDYLEALINSTLEVDNSFRYQEADLPLDTSSNDESSVEFNQDRAISQVTLPTKIVEALKSIKTILQISGPEKNLNQLEKAIEDIKAYAAEENGACDFELIINKSKKLYEEEKRKKELIEAFAPFDITDPVEADLKILPNLQKVLEARNEALRLAQEGRRQDGFKWLQKGIQEKSEGEIPPLVNIRNYAITLKDSNPTKQALNQFIKDTTTMLRDLQEEPSIRSHSSYFSHQNSKDKRRDLINSMPNLAPVSQYSREHMINHEEKKKDGESATQDGQENQRTGLPSESLHTSGSDSSVLTKTGDVPKAESTDEQTTKDAELPVSRSQNNNSGSNPYFVLNAISAFAGTTKGKITIGVVCVLLVAGITVATCGVGGVVTGATVAGAAIGAHAGISAGSGAILFGVPTLYGFFGKAKQLGSEISYGCLPLIPLNIL